MIYLLLAIVLLNLYFTIKRFDMSFESTLEKMCVYIVLDCLAFIVVAFEAFVHFLSGKNLAILIICVLAAILTIIFDALTINKYVKIKTKEADESNVFKRK